MATIGTLSVSLKARTEKFERGLKRARRTLRKFSSMLPGVNTLLAGFAAAMTVRATVGFIRGSLRAIDATTKFADRIGMTTEGLVALQHAAAITGVKVESLQMGLQRMTRRVAEAAQGTGEARNALKELGVDALALSRMRPEDQFKVLAGAMKNVAGQGDKVRLAMKLFDSEGVALVNTLSLGAAGLDRMAAEADDLGISFSRMDAAKVERANDAMARTGAMITGVGRTIAVELAPLIAASANSIVEWGQSGVGWSGKIKAAMSEVAEVFAFVVDTLSVAFGLFKGFESVVDAHLVAAQQLKLDTLKQLEKIVRSTGVKVPDFGAKRAALELTLMTYAARDTHRAAEEMLRDGLAGQAGKDARAMLQGLADDADKLAAAAAKVKAPAIGGGAGSPAADPEAARAAQKAEADLDRVTTKFAEFLRTTAPSYQALSDRLGQHVLLYEDLIDKGMKPAAKIVLEIVDSHREKLELLELQQKLAEKAQRGMEKVAAQEAKSAALQKKKAESQAKSVERYNLMIARAGALNDVELRAIDNAERRSRIVKELGEEIGNQTADKLEAAEAAKRQREEEEKTANAIKGQADDAERKARASKKDLDITKRFANFNGMGGGFGFGSGRVGASNPFGTNVYQKKAPQAAGPKVPAGLGGGGGAAPGAKFPDPTPQLKAMTKAFTQLRSHWDKLTKALVTHSDAVTGEIDRIGKSVTSTVGKLSQAVSRNTQRISKLEKDLAAAAAVGVAGQ